MNEAEPIRLTRAQVREVDRLAMEKYHMPSIVLMENAARAVVDAAMQMLADVKGPEVVIVCGGGNNGGDGLAVARHLHNRGVDVGIVLALNPQKFRGDAAANWRIVHAMDLPWEEDDQPQLTIGNAELVIDALFGTGLETAPRDTWLIERMNERAKRILAIDLPSGLDCDSGAPLDACVRATETVTFVAEKAGFANPASKQFTGRVTIGDIGCPRELIEEVMRDMR